MTEVRDNCRGKAMELVSLCVAIALLYSAERCGKSYFLPDVDSLTALVSETFNIAAYALVVLLWRPFERVFCRPGRTQVATLLATACVSTVGWLLSLMSGSECTRAFSWVGLLLHSTADSALLLACLCPLCQDRPRRAAVVLPAALLLSGLALTVQQYSGLFLRNVLVLAGPLLAVTFFLLSNFASVDPKSLSESSSSPVSIPPSNQDGASFDSCGDRPSMPLWPFVLMAAYDLVCHYVATIEATWSFYGMMGYIAVSVFALMLALVKGNDYTPLPLNKIALPCVVAALMCLTLPGYGPAVTTLLANVGSAAFYLFVFVTFIMMCQRHEFNPIRALGALLAAEHIGHFLGDLVGYFFVQTFPAGGVPLQLFATCVATVLVLMSTLFLNDLEVARIFGLVPEASIGWRRGFSNVSDSPRGASSPIVSVMSSRENVAWRCATAARAYNLTVREEEVLELMMLGMSNQEIAETMVILPGTARTHVSHICRKLGTDSRTEAIEIARSASI